MYQIKEIFYTLQGEGFHSGRPAVFCRFTGCNLWSGREEDRKDAICDFCDTDFRGTDGVLGGKYTSAEHVVNAIKSCWPSSTHSVFVVLTGGEPMLQVDDKLITAMHKAGFEISIETNGTLAVINEIDWITVSPKADAELVQIKGDELKLVYPQFLNPPENYIDLEFEHFYLQPKDLGVNKNFIQETLEYCLKNPKWKLSLQTHKYLQID